MAIELSPDCRFVGVASASAAVLVDTRGELEPACVELAGGGESIAFAGGRLWIADGGRLRSLGASGVAVAAARSIGEGRLQRIGEGDAALWCGAPAFVVDGERVGEPLPLPLGARVTDRLAGSGGASVAIVDSEVLVVGDDGVVCHRLPLGGAGTAIADARSVDGGILAVLRDDDGNHRLSLVGLHGERAFTLAIAAPRRLRLAGRRRFALVLTAAGELVAVDLRYGRKVAGVAAPGVSDFDVDAGAAQLALERVVDGGEPQLSLLSFRELFAADGARRIEESFAAPVQPGKPGPLEIAGAATAPSTASAPPIATPSLPRTSEAQPQSASRAPIPPAPRRPRVLPARQPIEGAPARELLCAHVFFAVERLRALLRFGALERGAARDVDAAIVQRDFETAYRHEEAMRAAHALPFEQLCQALELDAFDRDALLLAAAPHFDASIRADIRRFRAPSERAHVDGSLVVDLVSRTRVEALAESQRFGRDWAPVRAGLVELVPIASPHVPALVEHELVPTAKLLGLFGGELTLGARLGGFVELRASDGDEWIGVIDDAAYAGMAALCGAACAADRGSVTLLVGAPGVGKERIACSLAAATGHTRVLAVDFRALCSDTRELGRALADLGREAAMLDATLLLRDVPSELAAGPAAALRTGLEHLAAHVIVTTTAAGELRRAATLLFDIVRADWRVRERGWQRSLAAAGLTLDADEVARLAQQYPLTPARIERTVALAAARAAAAGADHVRGHLAACAESQLDSELSQYADRSRSQARLDDLVLGDDTRADVEELIHAVRARSSVLADWGFGDRLSRGRGICALFNGAPGTGKTFAAGVIANELELPMFRIDVSSILDRFVGETEKNLAALFREAADHRALLLFDEADSLFAKRVQAKDATDRYTNVQTNLLLNLVEDYEGVVILTTNLKSGIDTAFLRRVAFKITFAAPERAERLALWRQHLPARAPLGDDVDLDALALDYPRVSGGDIKNAVLRAAFRAWPQSITQSLLREALAAEVRSGGGVIAELPSPASATSRPHRAAT